MVFNTTVLTLPLESNFANAANFLIFDIGLISLVFYLTSDVSGRLNDADLSAGEPRRLFLTSPPVIGGGLCSTRQFRAALLLFARVVGLVLILVTNLTIDGKSDAVPVEKRVELVVPGTVSNFTSENTEISMLRRTGCLGITSVELSPINGEENVTYYGEIRDDICEVDKDLVFRDAVKFSQQLRRFNFTSGSCNRNELRVRFGISAALFYCDYARIFCFMEFHRPERVDLPTCRGVVRYNDTTYLAGEGTIWPEMPIDFAASRIVTGIDWKDDRWFDAGFTLEDASMEDYFHAMYGASVVNRSVVVIVEKSKTEISAFWFAALAVKVVLVAVLGVTSFGLWKRGFRTVAHDEKRLAQLLRRRIEENDPRLTVREDAALNIYLSAEHSNGRLQVFAAGRPGATGTQPGISGNVDQTDINYLRHLEEAQHY